MGGFTSLGNWRNKCHYDVDVFLEQKTNYSVKDI